MANLPAKGFVDSLKGGSMFRVRPATPKDIPSLCALLHAYMQEAFGQPWQGVPEAVERDGFGAKFDMVVAETAEDGLIGFAAWLLSYDLHHCIRGEVIDMFVHSKHRSRGIAIALLAAVAAEVQRRGGKYLKGQAVERTIAQRLYERMAICFPGADYMIGGRAFRRLAELAGKGVREIARGLPRKAWNHEP
jgi:GNAT superfamily N-acetyltransferase